MKRVRLLCALLALVLVLGTVLAACSSDEPSASPPPGGTTPGETTPDNSGTPGDGGDEGRALADQYGLPYSGMEAADPITFKLFDRAANTPPDANNPILNIIEQITNVKIEYEFLVGTLEEKMGIMLAGGDLGGNDLAFFGGEAGPFLDSGIALPLQDLIEANAPNLRAHYSPWWDAMRHTDGNIYIAEIFGTPVGDQREMEHWGTAFWLQKDVLDYFERAPADLDEYFDFIYEYMQAFPEIDGVPTSGFEILTEGWRRFCIDNPGMFMAGHANWGPATDLGGFAGDRWAHDWNRDYYKKLNEQFQRGVINAETLTLTFDQYLAKLASGAVLGMSDQLWNFNSGLDPVRAEGRYNRTYLPMDFTFAGIEPNYMDSRQFTGSNGLIIYKDTADPVRLIKYLDYIIQEDVQRFLEWGIEGEHWYYNDSGRMERPDEQRELQRDTRWRTDNLGYFLRNLMPKMQGTYSDGNSTDPGNQPEEYFAALTDYDRDLFAKLGILTQTGLMKSIPKERPVYYPFWSMSWEDGHPASLVDQRLEDARVNYLSRLVITDDFDALWAEYVDAVNAIDQTPLFDEINSQIQQRIAAFGG